MSHLLLVLGKKLVVEPSHELLPPHQNVPSSLFCQEFGEHKLQTYKKVSQHS